MKRVNKKALNEPRYPRSGWIGVDLDGTLTKSVSGPNPLRIGPPVPLMLERVRHWVSTGREVRIFTARAGDKQQRRLVEHWCKTHGLGNLPITDRKDFRMVVLWDDRAVGVVTDLGVPILANRLTFLQRLKLSLTVLVQGSATVAINQGQLSEYSAAAVDWSRQLLE
jgi:hypothetical protein